MAPLFKVSFRDNMVGDMLTSLVKPLQDISGMFCYMAASHPHTEEELECFGRKGDMCPEWTHSVLNPIIAALPLVFRSLQCARRYYDTGKCRHLVNLGKYLTSLCVVMFASIKGLSAATIAVSACATVYSSYWDLAMDWDLSVGMFRGSHAQICTTDHVRCFSTRTYACAAVFDVLARCVWVISLMPLSFIADHTWSKEVYRVLISLLELLRRSVWSVLRIEHEQLATGSGFGDRVFIPYRTSGVFVSLDAPVGHDSRSPTSRTSRTSSTSGHDGLQHSHPSVIGKSVSLPMAAMAQVCPSDIDLSALPITRDRVSDEDGTERFRRCASAKELDLTPI